MRSLLRRILFAGGDEPSSTRGVVPAVPIVEGDAVLTDSAAGENEPVEPAAVNTESSGESIADRDDDVVVSAVGETTDSESLIDDTADGESVSPVEGSIPADGEMRADAGVPVAEPGEPDEPDEEPVAEAAGDESASGLPETVPEPDKAQQRKQRRGHTNPYGYNRDHWP